MESRAFIKAATALRERIKLSSLVAAGIDDDLDEERRGSIQKEVNQLFAGLANPTLPSAFRLRDAALEEGFTVPAAAREKLSSFENWSC